MKRILAILLCAFMFGVSGCSFFDPIGPIISIGVAWMEGEASKYYHSDQTSVYNAVQYALKDLDFTITNEETKGDTIYLKADAGDRFKIKIERVRDHITNLKIRVNIMGDKPYAELIYKKVDEYPGIKMFTSEKQLKRALYDD